MSAWLEHVKKTMKLHPGKPLKDVLKAAKATYEKAEGVAEYAVTGKKSHKKSHKGGAKKSKASRKSKVSRKSKASRKSVKRSRKMRRSRKH
jgi:hypothetical protein